MNYLLIAGSSACVYAFIVISIRLFGKKELAQLSIIDLVFILLISNAVQNAMVGADTSLLGGLCAAATLFIVNYTFKYFVYKFPKVSALVQGNAIMLIYNGEIQHDNLNRARIAISEIEEAAREHGVKNLKEVELAILEVDGNISIISISSKTNTKRKKKHYRDIL